MRIEEITKREAELILLCTEANEVEKETEQLVILFASMPTIAAQEQVAFHAPVYAA